MATEQQRKFAQLLYERIESNPKILKANREYIRKHVDYLKARGADPRTIEKHLYCLEKFLLALDPKVNVKTATREDIERAFGKIGDLKLAIETKQGIRTKVKAFYKHAFGEDIYYPKVVAWIKTTSTAKRKLPEDMLTENEVGRMLSATGNARNRAIIALLFDAGIRAGELLSMRIKDVEFNGEPRHVRVNGKTGMRRIPVFFSVPYISRYMELMGDKKPDDPLWNVIGSWSNTKKSLDEAALVKVLKDAGRKAGISKRIYPHLFRHSRATYYANRLTEQQLKVFFGWTGDSKMASTYVHLSGRDMDEALQKANAVAVPERSEEPELKVRECPRCNFPNGAEVSYCGRCGSALDIAIALRQKELEERVEKLAGKSFDSKNQDRKKVAKRIIERKEGTT